MFFFEVVQGFWVRMSMDINIYIYNVYIYIYVMNDPFFWRVGSSSC